MIDKYLISPFQKFVSIQSFSGILLLMSTIVAIIWANSPFGDVYQAMLNYKIGIYSADFKLVKPLILWVNDGLMTIFFFLIGLEIKRELLIGELNSPKKAAFPLFAAIGGMLFPVIIFLVLNTNSETQSGWGIPMATDIAFALAVLTVLGKRVPLSLKIFLTAFAIVDDLGAVLTIAIFYTEQINWLLLGNAAIILTLLFVLSYLKLYSKYSFVLGLVVWYLFLKSGIHPTIAGVLLAFTIPIRQRLEGGTYANKLAEMSDKFSKADDPESKLLTDEQVTYMVNIESWSEQVQSPLQHLEHRLHGWVAYFIIPIFALFNAGVVVTGGMTLEFSLAFNIAIALIIGKIIGVTFMTIVGVKSGLAALPDDIKYSHIIGVAFIAGIGFTMSIFIGNLAFAANPVYLDSAKVGILLGSIASGLIGFLILKFYNHKA